MISIKIFREKSDLKYLEITGHSGIKGKSIPCAAVSFLIQSINGFFYSNGNSILVDDGIICKIDLNKIKKTSKDLFDYIIFSLSLIARDYPNDINLEILEENDGT